MEVCSDGRSSCPPTLPLDRSVPSAILESRRDAISFCSSSNYYTLPRFERRDAISFEKSDKNAKYVRMLGDVRMRTKVDQPQECRKTSICEADRKLLDKLSSTERIPLLTSRFLSMHRRRRRRRPTIQISKDALSHIDDHYNSSTQSILQNIGDWNFNIFSLDTVTGGRPLLHVALHLFRKYNFIQKFRLDTVKLLQCFSQLEDGYHGHNPYHNAIHAADVTQAMHCYLQGQQFRDDITAFEQMTALLSAMAHDLDHPGVNQAFLIATSNHLAALYQNQSVLENHHWRSTIAVFHNCKVFDHFSTHEWDKLGSQIKSLILATDITRQQEFLQRFRECLNSKDFDYTSNPDQRHLLLQIALKCADICNPCRDWDLSKKWSERVCDEFFSQGDFERRLNIPVTPLCDRLATTVARIQTGFMDFVVTPLFMEWKKFAMNGLSETMIQNISKNKSKWQIVIEEDKAKMEQDIEADKENIDTSDSCSARSVVSDHTTDLEDSVELAERIDSFPELSTRSGYDDRDDYSEGTRSLSPVSEEDFEDFFFGGGRRHSMPPQNLQRDVSRISRRRDLPNPIYLQRRQSLPSTIIMSSTSSELLKRLQGKDKSNDISIEDLTTVPNISSLMPGMDISKPPIAQIETDCSYNSQQINLSDGKQPPSASLSSVDITNTFQVNCSTFQRKTKSDDGLCDNKSDTDLHKQGKFELVREPLKVVLNSKRVDEGCNTDFRLRKDVSDR